MNITFQGNPVTLAGKELRTGDKLPDFTVTGNDLDPVSLGDTAGVRVFVAVPSLDTPVCDLEVRSFNQRIAELGGATVWVVSMDLPFAQSRWCAAAGISAVKTVSDYKDRSFAAATGTMVQELGLLARAVFVVDSTGTVTYAEYVGEIGNPPDFETVIAEVKKAK